MHVCICVSGLYVHADSCFEFLPHLCTVSYWHIQSNTSRALPTITNTKQFKTHSSLQNNLQAQSGRVCEEETKAACSREQGTPVLLMYWERTTYSLQIPKVFILMMSTFIICMFHCFSSLLTPQTYRNISCVKQFHQSVLEVSLWKKANMSYRWSLRKMVYWFYDRAGCSSTFRTWHNTVHADKIAQNRLCACVHR